MTRLPVTGAGSARPGQHYLTEGTSQLQLCPSCPGSLRRRGTYRRGRILLIGLHNPVEMAEMVASLDVIWGGRVVFASARLSRRGVPTPSRSRGASGFAAFEGAGGGQAAGTEESVTVDNDVCTLAGLTRTCVRAAPHPPIWVAANNDMPSARGAIGDTCSSIARLPCRPSRGR